VARFFMVHGVQLLFYYKIVHVVQNNEKKKKKYTRQSKIKETCNKSKHVEDNMEECS